MQTVLEQGCIDKPLTFDVGLIQLSFIPVCSLNTCNISVKLCRGFALQCFLLLSVLGHSCPAGRQIARRTHAQSSRPRSGTAVPPRAYEPCTMHVYTRTYVGIYVCVHDVQRGLRGDHPLRLPADIINTTWSTVVSSSGLPECF